MKQVSRKQWIKFGIVTLLYLLFLLWVRSWWGLVAVPLIYDIYITKKIPWNWWRKSENAAVRSVMSWVDAIVFALVAVYFVNIYLFQNYFIVIGEIAARGRLPVRKQGELRAACTQHAALHAPDPAYTARVQLQVVHRMAAMEI